MDSIFGFEFYRDGTETAEELARQEAFLDSCNQDIVLDEAHEIVKGENQ